MENTKIDIKEIRSIRFVWDKMANVMTVISTMGMLGIAIFVFVQSRTEGLEMIWAGLLLIVVTALLATFTPLGLIVDDEYIVVKKLVGRIVIKKCDIISATKVDAHIVRRSGRMAGSSGAFGYWGKFRHRSIGSYTLYATNLERLVLIETTKKKYVINY